MILVCGGLADVVTELVCARLEDLRYPYRLLDLGFYPDRFRVHWSWNGGTPTGAIVAPDWSLDLHDVGGVFVRYVGSDGHAPLANVPAEMTDVVLAEAQAGLGALLEVLPCPVANRMNGSMSNHSKPYQALLVRESGLRTPPTLVTSDPDAARAFYDTHGGEVIFKSLSGVRSVVRRMEARDLDRLHLLRDCPAQFQTYLRGDNVRVHTVGDEVFATRIRSAAVDYRYAKQQGADAEMEPTTLPPEIAEACIRLSRTLGLVIAGIDLKETPDGAFYCFEINPSPGFAYYEQRTAQPISAALADLLHRGTVGQPVKGGETAISSPIHQEQVL
jgi:glutathione synthase/RimK-type ligase-like ATP-grasp enzyme